VNSEPQESVGKLDFGLAIISFIILLEGRGPF